MYKEKLMKTITLNYMLKKRDYASNILTMFYLIFLRMKISKIIDFQDIAFYINRNLLTECILIST